MQIFNWWFLAVLFWKKNVVFRRFPSQPSSPWCLFLLWRGFLFSHQGSSEHVSSVFRLLQRMEHSGVCQHEDSLSTTTNFTNPFAKNPSSSFCTAERNTVVETIWFQRAFYHVTQTYYQSWAKKAVMESLPYGVENRKQ